MTDDYQNQSNTKYYWWMAITFFLLTLSFIFDIWTEKREIKQNPSVDPKYFTKETVRKPMEFPILKQEGETFRCNDCHQNIEPSKVQKSFFAAHEHIILEHGVNNYCSTCHSPNNREALLDINKNDIPFSRSELACLQCHGPIYNDWVNGVHGRMSESWDKSQRTVEKITCVACHDPHSPKFKSMGPSPAPVKHNFLDQYVLKEQYHE